METIRFLPAPIVAHSCPAYNEARMNEICDGLFSRGYSWIEDNGRLDVLTATGAVVKNRRMVILWRPTPGLMWAQ